MVLQIYCFRKTNLDFSSSIASCTHHHDRLGVHNLQEVVWGGISGRNAASLLWCSLKYLEALHRDRITICYYLEVLVKMLIELENSGDIAAAIAIVRS